MIAALEKYFHNLTSLNTDKSFYFKIALKAWLIYCLVYSFMIFQFCWGNHDWWPLKERVYISDGFFEARYNQHIFSVLLFDGQILPVIVYFTSFAAITLFALLLAAYLEIPRTQKNWLFFALFIGLNPHIFVLFSYVYIMLPFICWGAVGLCCLFLIEPPYFSIKMLTTVVLALLVLGGYPPIIGFICTTFVAKQIILISHHNIPIKQLIKNTIAFIITFGLSFLIHQKMMIPLITGNNFNTKMYNIQIISKSEIFNRFLHECIQAITQLWQKYPFLDNGYWQILLLILLAAVIQTMYIAKRKKITYLLLIALFIASRTAFIVAEKADLAAFRLTYWGKLGLYASAWSVLLQNKSTCIKNLIFITAIACLCIFIKIDFNIQKTWNLGFKAERLAHTRLAERIVQNPSFNPQQKYAFLNIGIPHYKQHFYTGKTILDDNELLSILTLPADLGETLFWEEEYNPIAIKFGVWEKRLWRVNNPRFQTPPASYFNTNDEVFSQLRYWMYMDSAAYPNDKSIYIDNQYIFLVIDKKIFNKNKELILNKMKSMLI